MATLFGHVGEFDDSKEEWIQYVERLDHFYEANGITENDKKRAILLTTIGPVTYKTLRNVVMPRKPGEMSYQDLVAAMKTHYRPTPSEIVQRFRFNSRFRHPGESVSMFVSELRSLAEHCNFENTLEVMLRDRLVCGINDPNTQRRLLSEVNLTFQKAFEIAQGLESAVQNLKTLQGSQVLPSEEIHKVEKIVSTHVSCYRCGKSNHSSFNCRFKTARCYNCGKFGHIKEVCRGKAIPNKIQYLQKERSQMEVTEDKDEYDLFTITSTQARKPILTTVEVYGKSLTMEIDTGASFSVISYNTYDNNFKSIPLEDTKISLKTYSGEKLKIHGIVGVDVRYEEQVAHLPLLVVGVDGPSLMGRDWLAVFRLNWKEIYYVENCSIQSVLQRFTDVFKEGLGTLKGYEAKIHINPDVVPRFCKARTVPYALRARVEDELERLVELGVIEPVQFADWAAPIVPVLKSDKSSIRICGDFKITINRATKLDQYPIPKIEDLFAKLSGGKMFTKLDLSQAYQQVRLDAASKELVVINTHRGLFRYNRLPFGVSSAPGIFQRMMENLLRGIDKVVVYLDDILITGTSEEDHLSTLEKVLKRLQDARLRLKRNKCKFMLPSVSYLGYQIDAEGLHPLPEKVAAVQSAPVPKSVTELKSFLGLLTYYSKFLPNLSTTLSPLYELLKSSTKWLWSRRHSEAFQTAKNLLTSSKLLVHFDPARELMLSCGASAYGIGAVLSHKFADGSEKPIGFASRTLSTAEKNYSQIEKEGLSCVFGVKRFHSFLYGHHFTMCTDHKPLLGLIGEHCSVPAQASARIQRWALTLSMYNYTIKFKRTGEHSNADALSRFTVTSDPS